METSEYITVKNKSTLSVLVSDWSGTHTLKVKPADVVKYYATEAHNLTSGARTLAGYTSDWRGVDYLAKECLEVFKDLNRTALVKEAKKYNMTLRS